jgi:hypothetical protein
MRLYIEEAAKHNEYYRYFSFSYFLCSFGALIRKVAGLLHKIEEFFADLSRKTVASPLRKHGIYPWLSNTFVGQQNW